MTRRIPSQFQLGPHTIRVRVVSEAVMKQCNIAANGPAEAKEDAPFGLWVYGENAILLQKVRVGFNKDAQMTTFWHEYFHALFDLVGESKLSGNEGLVERCAIMHLHATRTLRYGAAKP